MPVVVPLNVLTTDLPVVVFVTVTKMMIDVYGKNFLAVAVTDVVPLEVILVPVKGDVTLTSGSSALATETQDDTTRRKQKARRCRPVIAVFLNSVLKAQVGSMRPLKKAERDVKRRIRRPAHSARSEGLGR